MTIMLDCVYQFRRMYPVEALDVAFRLACVPYFVLRGVVDRVGRSGK